MIPLFCIALLLPSAFADKTTCQDKAEKAALKLAEEPREQNPSLVIEVRDSWLLRKNGSTLTYEVRIDSEYNDGASTQEFPSDFYQVSARGTEAKCRVTSVKLQ